MMKVASRICSFALRLCVQEHRPLIKQPVRNTNTTLYHTTILLAAHTYTISCPPQIFRPHLGTAVFVSDLPYEAELATIPS